MKTRIDDWILAGKPWSQWKTFLALDTYVILADEFGWESFTSVIKQYYQQPLISVHGDMNRLDVWARKYAKEVDKNLCSYFEWWGWQLSDETKNACAELPALDEDLIDKYFRKHYNWHVQGVPELMGNQYSMHWI